MRVFLSVASLSLEYGGPAVSVLALGRALDVAGVEVGLWAPDGSARAIETVGGVEPLSGTLREAIASFGRIDILHDNGVWLPHNHAIAAAARSNQLARVVSVRGMLAPWALRHKGLKKQVAWRLYQRRDLLSGTALHATSEAEAGDLRRLVPGVPVITVPNGIFAGEMPLPELSSAVPSGRRIALSLGRLYPVKGLPLLIKAWARVRPPGWRLVLAGPDEQGHKAELEVLIRRFNLEDVVSFGGMVSGDAKAALLKDAELFLMPSLSESFGMAVAEALVAGVPVVTTTAAPWSAIVSEGCGWQTTPTLDGIANALAEATKLDAHQLSLMGKRGSAFVSREFNWSNLAGRFIDLYERALGSPRVGAAA